MMSPAVMYSLAFSTLAENFSRGTLDSNGDGGTSSGTLPAGVRVGCSSSETSRSISPTASS